ncbi:invasion associated locus B family protein [Aliamphritea spongicola]|nr:invasion associated locus B family protein [Aliamphritea spongicola]
MLRSGWTQMLLLAVSLGLVLSAVTVRAGEIDGKTFRDWRGQCETAPDGREYCYILQRLQRVDNERTLMITQVGYHLETKEALVMFHLPPVLDPKEMLLFKTDDNTAISVGYSCDSQRCRGDMVLDDRLLSELKKDGREWLLLFIVIMANRFCFHCL